MPNKSTIDKILYVVIVFLIGALVSLNLYMIARFEQEMVVRPKEVLATIEERLEVTPSMVMERLNEIEASHMKWVKEHREIK